MQIKDVTGRKWSLTQDAFDGLLEALGPDREDAANRYLRIHRDLVRLFELRNCSAPADYADETMNRCARKIAEGEGIRDLATYSIGVARMLLREMARDCARYTRSLEEVPEPWIACSQSAIDLETRVEALRRGLGRLCEADRSLIMNYYEGDRSERIRKRKTMMQTLGIPSNTLRMRALRIREKLQLCAENN
jgi:DNA-directed RNA polymerase specialized sigma24 family protein